MFVLVIVNCIMVVLTVFLLLLAVEIVTETGMKLRNYIKCFFY